MKLGCCVNMLGDKQDIIGRKYIRLLAELGYDYVELPLAQVMELNDNDFSGLVKELHDIGIPCECCNNFFPGEIRITGKDVSHDKIEKYVKKAMHRASCLGAKVIVLGSSKAKNVPEGFSYDIAFEQIVNALKTIDKYAIQYDIVIALEPLNRDESNIILNLSDCNKILNTFSFRNIKLLVDYYHFVKENDSAKVLLSVMKDLVHVHFAEPEGRVFPFLMKREYSEFINILLSNGYKGRMSVEAYSRNPRADMAKFISLMSGY